MCRLLIKFTKDNFCHLVLLLKFKGIRNADCKTVCAWVIIWFSPFDLKLLTVFSLWEFHVLFFIFCCQSYILIHSWIAVWILFSFFFKSNFKALLSNVSLNALLLFGFCEIIVLLILETTKCVVHPFNLSLVYPIYVCGYWA